MRRYKRYRGLFKLGQSIPASCCQLEILFSVDGQLLASPEFLCEYVLNLTREVLEIQTEFLVEVKQQFQKIKNTTQIIWADEFQNVLTNCQSLIDYDLHDISTRLAGITSTDRIGKEQTRWTYFTNLVNYNYVTIS